MTLSFRYLDYIQHFSKKTVLFLKFLSINFTSLEFMSFYFTRFNVNIIIRQYFKAELKTIPKLC